MIDFNLDGSQEELRSVLRRWAAHHEDNRGTEPKTQLPSAWKELAELGVFGLGTALGGGGALEIQIAMQELGRIGFPGPLFATVLAASLLQGTEQEAVVTGTRIAALLANSLLPWGPLADVILELSEGRAWLVRVTSARRVQTATGDPCSQVVVERIGPLEGSGLAIARTEIAVAAYQVAAAEQELELVAAYARDRLQFGQAIGSFQAVAHPIAEAYVWVRAAAALTVIAAAHLDSAMTEDFAIAELSATKARQAAGRASLSACYAAHQAMGAVGITNEGPLTRLSLAIRQSALSFPRGLGDDRLDLSLGLI